MKRRDIDLVAEVIKGLKGKVKGVAGCPVKTLVYNNFVTALKKANGNFNEPAFRKSCGIVK